MYMVGDTISNTANVVAATIPIYNTSIDDNDAFGTVLLANATRSTTIEYFIKRLMTSL